MEFIEVVEELCALKKRQDLTPVAYADLREPLLAKALVSMAESLGARLATPIRIDSRGEMSIVALHESGRPVNMGCGEFGEAFAEALSAHNPRTGILPGAFIEAEAGWCSMSHFDVEKMVMEHYRKVTDQEEA